MHEATPASHWKIPTILGAMSTRGMIATMTIEEALDTDIFLAYLDHVLCPQPTLPSDRRIDNCAPTTRHRAEPSSPGRRLSSEPEAVQSPALDARFR